MDSWIQSGGNERADEVELFLLMASYNGLKFLLLRYM